MLNQQIAQGLGMLVCLILGAWVSMVQVAIYEQDIPTRNAYYPTTRWVQIISAIIFTILTIYVIPMIPIALEIFIATTIFVLIAVQLPKRWAQDPKVAQSAFALYKTIHPLLRIITFPIQFETFFEDEVLEEDIREMINVGSESGNINQPQKEMIENIFEMDDMAIEEICTHRSDVIVLYKDQSADTWRQIIHDNRHTFYPVCGKDDDDIIGVLDTRDYFRLDDDSDLDYIMEKAMDEPFFEAEGTKVDTLFKEMTNRKNYFTVVLDEYGGMTGIVTLHDVMESLVGEIYEEDEIDPKDIVQIHSNTWKINGSASLEDVEKVLEIELYDDENETFNGYLLSQYGHIPEDGAQFTMEIDNLSISITEVEGHRIREAIVEKRGVSS